MLIEGSDDTGMGFRLEIDLLMLNDILGGVLDHLRLDGRPATSVCWNPKEDVVELRSNAEGEPTTTSELGEEESPKE